MTEEERRGNDILVSNRKLCIKFKDTVFTGQKWQYLVISWTWCFKWERGFLMWKLADIDTDSQWGSQKCTWDYPSQYFRHTEFLVSMWQNQKAQKVKILKYDKKFGLKCKFWIKIWVCALSRTIALTSVLTDFSDDSYRWWLRTIIDQWKNSWSYIIKPLPLAGGIWAWLRVQLLYAQRPTSKWNIILFCDPFLIIMLSISVNFISQLMWLFIWWSIGGNKNTCNVII